MRSIRPRHALVIATWIGTANLAVACGSGGGGGILDDDDGDPDPSVCCDAECVSMFGSFSFLSEGQKTSVTGSATIRDVQTDAIVAEVELNGTPSLETFANETDLAPYDGATIEIEVSVDAVGFAPFSELYTLDVEHQEICCSSCTTALGNFDIELGPAGNTFIDGCTPGGGDPACPLTVPTTSDTCSANLCCNYDGGGDAVFGCICNPNGTGWNCQQNTCACTGS